MAATLRIRPVRIAALLCGIALSAGCAVAPANQGPAPVITGSQTIDMSEPPQPLAATPRRSHAVVRSASHRLGVTSLRSKRHARLGKKRTHLRAARRAAPHSAGEQEAAANAGVVHHIGPKIIPLE